jgi:hypothetical protein
MALGFEAFMPLHLDPGFRPTPVAHISLLFRGYLLIRFNPGADPWRRIYRSRGIAGIIGQTTDRPTPIGVGIIEELIARTSARGILDDPADAPPVEVERQHWQDITRLSATARAELLLRLFGREDVT